MVEHVASAPANECTVSAPVNEYVASARVIECVTPALVTTFLEPPVPAVYTVQVVSGAERAKHIRDPTVTDRRESR